ncbi:hypothetical protein AX774_g2187 [Zancudomyces culisetae]|uniref:Uncharacterized protein n=1 Tax=Zancudomyces culisetae TaxID=1213189 RepID=A0A1R1PTM7_ZANCU|nr:hypothetical protein AX774_g2187 [Zancudomyces culisetae]|eukprot:OMH84294.1 hypothetical protein AX774_g2187 [Zancudomyces culisetae]
MVNILLTSALLIASSFVASSNIPDVQLADANTPNAQIAQASGEADYKLNHCGCHHHHHHHKTLAIEMFGERLMKNRVGFKTIRPDKCYRLPNINSCLLDGGKPGEGIIMFCTGSKCNGSCRSLPRLKWYTPGDMNFDIGGHANSVYWTTSEDDS